MRSSNYLRQAKRRQNRAIVDQPLGYSANDQVVGKDTLASLLDVSLTSVERWIRDGMPVLQRGDQFQEWMFNLPEVKDWRSTQED